MFNQNPNGFPGQGPIIHQPPPVQPGQGPIIYQPPPAPQGPEKTEWPPAWFKATTRTIIILGGLTILVIGIAMLGMFALDALSQTFDHLSMSLKHFFRRTHYKSGSGIEVLALFAMVIIGIVGALKVLRKEKKED